MTFRHGRFLLPILYAAALIFPPHVYAQTKPSHALITVYKTPT